MRSKHFFIYYYTNSKGRLLFTILLFLLCVPAGINSCRDGSPLGILLALGFNVVYHYLCIVDETWDATREEWKQKYNK
jgi:hypothetical protein